MCKLNFELLQKDDADIDVLKKLHNHPSVKKFISIGKNYFNYVTETENVFYCKILLNDRVIGGIHFEIENVKMYLSVFISPDFRNKRFAKESIKYVLENYTDKIDVVEVCIDENNLPSLRLFESLGFIFIENDGKLKTYQFSIR